MTYDTITAATFRFNAATERAFNGHRANLQTYGLIVAVVALTGISNALSFFIEHLDRLPEYRLMLRLAVVWSKRWAVRGAIATVKTFERYGITKTVQAIPARSSQVLDAVFCLR